MVAIAVVVTTANCSSSLQVDATSKFVDLGADSLDTVSGRLSCACCTEECFRWVLCFCMDIVLLCHATVAVRNSSGLSATWFQWSYLSWKLSGNIKSA